MKLLDLRSYLDDAAADTKVSRLEKDGNTDEKRASERKRISATVFIEARGTVFKTKVRDLSRSSIKLRDRISILDQPVILVTLQAGANIQLRCRPLIRDKEVIRGAWKVILVDAKSLDAYRNFLQANGIISF